MKDVSSAKDMKPEQQLDVLGGSDGKISLPGELLSMQDSSGTIICANITILKCISDVLIRLWNKGYYYKCISHPLLLLSS